MLALPDQSKKVNRKTTAGCGVFVARLFVLSGASVARISPYISSQLRDIKIVQKRARTATVINTTFAIPLKTRDVVRIEMRRILGEKL